MQKNLFLKSNFSFLLMAQNLLLCSKMAKSQRCRLLVIWITLLVSFIPLKTP